MIHAIVWPHILRKHDLLLASPPSGACFPTSTCWQSRVCASWLERHAPTARAQGWSESQLSVALVLLNLAGGESVDDIAMLEQDQGLGQVVRAAELQGVRRRSLPSPSALRRYLESFQGGAAGAWTGLHPRARRRPARPGKGQRRAHALPAAPGAADAGHARHGRHCGGDAEADGALQLRGDARLPAAHDLLGGGRPGRPLRVPRRQRARRPRAAARARGGASAPARGGGDRHEGRSPPHSGYSSPPGARPRWAR